MNINHLPALAVSALLGLGTVAPALSAPQTKSYVGAWFSVRYPANWKVTPARLRPLAIDEKSDGAWFTSPDQKARFYVYAPLWNGTPSDALLQKGETLASKKQQKSTRRDGANSLVVTTWTTIRGPRGAYSRALLDVENQTLNTRYTFGFQFRDQKTYRQHLGAFTRFKSSLQQFSD